MSTCPECGALLQRIGLSTIYHDCKPYIGKHRQSDPFLPDWPPPAPILPCTCGRACPVHGQGWTWPSTRPWPYPQPPIITWHGSGTNRVSLGVEP